MRKGNKYYFKFADHVRRYQKSEKYKIYRRLFDAVYRKTPQRVKYLDRYYITNRIDMCFNEWKRRRTRNSQITTIDTEIRYWDQRSRFSGKYFIYKD